MRHLALLLATLGHLAAAGQRWSYIGTYLGVPVPLDYVVVENLSRGGYAVLNGGDTLEVDRGVGMDEHGRTSASNVFPLGANPYDERATFGVSAPAGGDVAVVVYDAMGRRVAALDAARSAPGVQVFHFQAERPGIYFVHAVVDRDQGHVLRLLQTGSTAGHLLQHGGNLMQYVLKSGDRDGTFRWNVGDRVRHTAYATLCGGEASHSLIDVPPDRDATYNMQLSLDPPGTACLFISPERLDWAICMGQNWTGQFHLYESGLTGRITSEPLDGYTFSTEPTGLFLPTLDIAAEDLPIDVHIHFTPTSAEDRADDLVLICDTTTATLHLAGRVTGSVPVGGITGDTLLCIGDSETFTSDGVPGGSWHSSDTAVATVNEEGTVVAVSNAGGTGTAWIVYTAPATEDCPGASDSLRVTVLGRPAGQSGMLHVCMANQWAFTPLEYGLGGVPDGDGTWTDPSGNDVGALFYPATMAPGRYTYTVETPYCGVDTASVTVFVDTCLTITTEGDLAASETLCAGFRTVVYITGSTSPGAEVVVSATQGLELSLAFNEPYSDTVIVHADAAGLIPVNTSVMLRYPSGADGAFFGVVNFSTHGVLDSTLQVNAVIVQPTPPVVDTIWQNPNDRIIRIGAHASPGPCLGDVPRFQAVLQPDGDTQTFYGHWSSYPQAFSAESWEIAAGNRYSIRAVLDYPSGSLACPWQEYTTQLHPVALIGLEASDTSITFFGQPILGQQQYSFELAYDALFTATVPGYPVTANTSPFQVQYTYHGLTPGTTYYMKARALDVNGNLGPYHPDMPYAFATRRCPAQISDTDGNLYGVIQINDRCWMAENLRTTLYRDGTSISNETDDITWSELTTGAWCNYDNNPANDATYGKLYNWYAVNSTAQLCPLGWHVPSEVEWQELETALGMPGAELLGYDWRGSDANVGNKLKAPTPSWDGSNESGFAGLPGGRRNSDGVFYNLGSSSTWWSSSENGTFPWFRFLWDGQTGVGRSYGYKSYGYCVRCLRD